MLTGVSFGQYKTDFSAKEKQQLSEQLLEFVKAGKGVYTDGMTIQQWIIGCDFPNPNAPSPNDPLFVQVFNYIKKGASDSEILKGDTTPLINYTKKVIENQPDNVPNQPESYKRKWWQTLINIVIQVVVTILCPECGDVPPIFP